MPSYSSQGDINQGSNRFLVFLNDEKLTCPTWDSSNKYIECTIKT